MVKPFSQKRGTAIGTHFASSYAILALAKFEEEALDAYHQIPWTWWRYIDDIFMIWQHGEDGLREFVYYLNSIHPTHKFIYIYSKTETEFLDVNVIKEGNSITTDLYIKETDSRLLDL